MANFREKSVTGIVLKKQQLGEADELVTVFTKQSGKVRAVAKSSKLAKSRLQYQLQPMFNIDFVLVGKGPLPKIIQAQAREVYGSVHQNPYLLQLWYVAAELVLKATPDEQPNEQLYGALEELLTSLDNIQTDNDESLLHLIRFKIIALEALGLAVQAPTDAGVTNYFSNEHGGFISGIKPSQGITVSNHTVHLFAKLRSAGTPLDEVSSDPGELNGLLAQYIAYQLERELRSEKFISSSSS